MHSSVRIRAKVKIPLLDGSIEGDFFTFDGLSDAPLEHIAIGLGNYQTQATPLVRIHSECLTGDVFGSQRCDCGAQLQEGIERIHQAGGYLLYLRQEGRGIGLYNKLDAYELQDQGMDTFEANQQLGFHKDARDYLSAAEMLKALGNPEIELLSNNPEKELQLEEFGILVKKRHPTFTYQTPHNSRYLAAKVEKAQHSLNVAGFDLGTNLGLDAGLETHKERN